MKKVFFVLLAFALTGLLTFCGGKKETKGEEYVAQDEQEKPAAAGNVIALGEELVKGSDCKTCHHKTNKIIGPSHTEVAQKYEFTDANVKMLAGKIIKGGSGVWGQAPMAGHPDIKQSDAEAMARYVLSLDGEKEH